MTDEFKIRYNGFNSSDTEVMHISRDGIWVNPDVEVTEAAQKVLNAMGVYMGSWKEQIEREYGAKLLREMADESGQSWQPNDLRREADELENGK